MTKQQMIDAEMLALNQHMRVFDFTVLEQGVSVLVYQTFGGQQRQLRMAVAYDGHIVTSNILEIR